MAADSGRRASADGPAVLDWSMWAALRCRLRPYSIMCTEWHTLSSTDFAPSRSPCSCASCAPLAPDLMGDLLSESLPMEGVGSNRPRDGCQLCTPQTVERVGFGRDAQEHTAGGKRGTGRRAEPPAYARQTDARVCRFHELWESKPEALPLFPAQPMRLRCECSFNSLAEKDRKQ